MDPKDMEIAELKATQAALVEALEAVAEQSYKTDGTAYVMSGSNMLKVRKALKLAKGDYEP